MRVREIGADDETEFIDRVRASRALHRPWTDLADSPARFGELLARAAAPTDAVFLIVGDADDLMVGVAHLSQIFLGNFRSAYLGFSASSPSLGRAT